jgi:hypothetical protein
MSLLSFWYRLLSRVFCAKSDFSDRARFSTASATPRSPSNGDFLAVSLAKVTRSPFWRSDLSGRSFLDLLGQLIDLGQLLAKRINHGKKRLADAVVLIGN